MLALVGETALGLVAGCVVPPKPRPLADWATAVDLGRALSAERTILREAPERASGGTGALPADSPIDITRMGPGQVDYKSGHWIDVRYWCEDGSGSAKRARLAFAGLCGRQTGVMGEDGFCKGSNGDLRFVAEIQERKGSCGQFAGQTAGGPAGDGRDMTLVRIRVIQPTGATPEEFRQHVAKAGFETSAQQAERVAREEQRRRIAQEARRTAALDEASRLALEAPQMKRRGTQVCKQVGPTTIVGFVEDWTDEKLRILVSKAFLTSAPTVVQPTRPGEVTWDWIAAWRPC